MRKPSELIPTLLDHLGEAGIVVCYPVGIITKSFFSMPSPILYLNKGAIRVFTVTENESEMTHWIAAEGDFVTPENYFNAVGYYVHLEVLEPCEAVLLPGTLLTDAIAPTSAMEHRLKLVWAEAKIQTLQINYSIISKKAALERYRLFKSFFPDYCSRFPLKHIASWLQMDQATLSRARAKRI
jgi:hypothetical protein